LRRSTRCRAGKGCRISRRPRQTLWILRRRSDEGDGREGQSQGDQRPPAQEARRPESIVITSVESESARGVIPQDFSFARFGNRLLEHRTDTPRKCPVRMWIVSIPEEVTIAHDIERRFHGRLIAAKRHEEVTFEILSRALAQILMFRISAEVPMLFHPL